MSIPYDRPTLVEILVYHYRREDSGCGCGWHDLGKSWPEHIATVYEEKVLFKHNLFKYTGFMTLQEIQEQLESD